MLIKKPMLVLLLFMMFLTLNGCSDEKADSQKNIYIPILADAAWLSSDGTFVNGLELAEEELNAAYSGKGFQIRTAVFDDQAQYETGVEIATKVAENPEVTAVFNLQNFDVSKTTGGILAEKEKLVLFPYGAYDSLFTKENPYVFSGVPAFSDLGRAMAGYAVEQGYERIAVYHNGSQSQEELVTAFELALQGTRTKVVDYVPSISSESEFDSIYSRWQALDADCVIIAQYGLDEAFEVLRLLRSRDGEIAVMGEPIFNRANALAQHKEIAEGIAVPSTLVIEDSAKLNSFRERYQLKYGKEADIWAVQGYDMLRLIVDTAVALDTNEPAKIGKALHDENGYQGIGRHISFAEGGALSTDAGKLPILICKDGMFR